MLVPPPTNPSPPVLTRAVTPNPGWFSFLYRAQNFSGAEDVPASLCTEQKPSVNLSETPAFTLDALCSLTITCKQCTKNIIHGKYKKWVLFLTHRRSESLLVTPTLDYLCQIYIPQQFVNADQDSKSVLLTQCDCLIQPPWGEEKPQKSWGCTPRK